MVSHLLWIIIIAFRYASFIQLHSIIVTYMTLYCIPSLAFPEKKNLINICFSNFFPPLSQSFLLLWSVFVRRLSQALAVSLHAAVTSPPSAPIPAVESSLLWVPDARQGRGWRRMRRKRKTKMRRTRSVRVSQPPSWTPQSPRQPRPCWPCRRGEVLAAPCAGWSTSRWRGWSRWMERCPGWGPCPLHRPQKVPHYPTSWGRVRLTFF